ncbi:hypothetical protein BLOT_010305 [Blomia tropicalis]|nr:hypothetical protein BLOT_010305 [Blomia tropicalis]
MSSHFKRQNDGDAGWQQYGQFIDSLTSFIVEKCKSDSLLKDMKLQTEQCSTRTWDELIVLFEQQMLNSQLDSLMSNYCASIFNMESIALEGKNNSIAEQFAEKPDDKATEGENRDQIYQLSEALRYAEYNSARDFVPKLLEYRGALFYKMDQTYEAILDFEKALRHLIETGKEPSKSLLYNLSNALAKIKEFDSRSKLKLFRETFNKYIDSPNSDPNTKNHLLSNMPKIGQLLNSVDDDMNEDDPLQSYFATIGGIITEPNNLMPNATKKVKTVEQIESGRSIISNESIKKGEPIMCEDPFSFYRFSNKHCGSCFRRLASFEEKSDEKPNYYSFIPCTGCNDMIFCDWKCRDRALDRFHRIECQSMISKLETELGIAYIALRTIFCAGGLNNALKQFEQRSEVNVTIHGNDYRSLLTLKTHCEEMNVDSVFCLMLTAHLLTHCLKQFGLTTFDDCPTRQHSIGSLILYHLFQMNTNLITISEVNYSEQQTIGSKPKHSTELDLPIGIGFYPTISLVNHSCDPNLVSTFLGSRLLLRASKPLEMVGTELTTTYGPTYSTMNYNERQSTLKSQYFFKCNCSACANRLECYDNSFSCSICNGPAFLNNDRSIIRCSRFNEHVPALDVKMAITELENFEIHLNASMDFIRNYETKNEEWKLVSAVVAGNKAEVIANKILFVLNQNYLKCKEQMIKCYLMMGQNDHAQIVSKHLVDIYERYQTVGDNRIKLLQMMRKFINILFIQLEEQNIDHGEGDLQKAARFVMMMDKFSHEFKGHLDKFEQILNVCKQNYEGNVTFQDEIDFLAKSRQLFADHHLS